MLSEPSQAPTLEISVERNGDLASISLIGELDHSQSERFAQELRRLAAEQTVRSLTLDMKGLRSIDPASLDVIRTAWARAGQMGVDAILVRASSEVRFALEESGLDRELPVIYECPDTPVSW